MVFGSNVIHIVIKAVDDFSKTFKKATISMQKLRSGMIGAGAIGGVLAVGLGSAAKAAMKVETGFSKVNTLLEKGQDSEKLFGDFVKETNVAMGGQGDQLDVLSGLYQTISAGISDTADAQTFMTAATKAAVGGSAELPTVITAGTKAMAAFGIEVEDSERVFDIFAATVKAGQTDMGQLASAFPRVSGVAAEMGMTLEETGGIFAGLTKVMRSPEEVATSMTAILSGLLKPTDDMKDAFETLGYESGQTMIKELGLMGTLEALQGTTDGSADSLGGLFGNIRAIKGIMPALGSASEDVAASIDIVSESAGLSQKQYEDMQDSAFLWGQAISELQNLQTDFGKSLKEVLLPILEFLVGVLKYVMEWWSGLSDETKRAIAVFAIITAATLLLAGAVGILMLVMSPVTLIIIGIGIAIAAIVVAFMYWKEWVMFLAKLMIRAVIEMGMAWEWLKDMFTIVWTAIKNVVISIWNFIVEFIENKINDIIDLINMMIKNLPTGIKDKLGIDVIGEVSFAGIKGEMTDIGMLSKKLEVERGDYRGRLESEADVLIEALADKIGKTEVNIENVYGTDPDEMMGAVQENISDKIKY